MRPTFDYIAPFYDSLAFTVYGNDLVRAKKQFIHLLPQQGRMLLMGGGTGNILNDIFINHGSLEIDYVEPSAKMVSIAQKKLDVRFRHRINFICGDHHAVPAESKYDAVTSFFVIDCMKQEVAFEFVKTITNSLKPGGIFLFADFFHTKNIFQMGLLWFMYRFFRIVTGIEASQLPHYDAIFRQLQLKEAERKDFLNGFIQSKVYYKLS